MGKNPKTIDNIMSRIVGMINRAHINGFTKRDHFIAYGLYSASNKYMHQHGIDFGDMLKNSKSYHNCQWIEYKNSNNQKVLDANILKGYIIAIDTKAKLLKKETA